MLIPARSTPVGASSARAAATSTMASSPRQSSFHATMPPPPACRKGRETMIAVIFEVRPAEGRTDAYLDLAARLRDDLATMDGFISVERFQSLTDPGKLLSLSFWRDEQAVVAWRNQARHRATQAAGRGGVFAEYRLRVAAVLRDYGLDDRAEAPEDSRSHHA
jgi:heme-degrading monooxygenase HmoA